MKHLSIWLTALLLGGVAPTAAALDYGSNPTLLAADGNAPALPSATHEAAPGVMAIDAGGGDESGDAGENATPGAPRPVRPTAAPRTSALPRAPGPSAGNPRVGAPTPESPTPGAAWQSLLPGSIQ